MLEESDRLRPLGNDREVRLNKLSIHKVAREVALVETFTS